MKCSLPNQRFSGSNINTSDVHTNSSTNSFRDRVHIELPVRAATNASTTSTYPSHKGKKRYSVTPFSVQFNGQHVAMSNSPTHPCVRQRLRWALAALGKFLNSSILAYYPITGAKPPDRCRSQHGAAKSLSESSTARRRFVPQRRRK